MKRNPEATCSTCPFWNRLPHSDTSWGRCQVQDPASWNDTDESWWCGRHPEFELVQPPGKLVRVDAAANPREWLCNTCQAWFPFGTLDQHRCAEPERVSPADVAEVVDHIKDPARARRAIDRIRVLRARQWPWERILHDVFSPAELDQVARDKETA